MKINKLNKYDNMKKFSSNSETVDNIPQYAENDVENVNNNEKNKNNIVDNEEKKKERENNDDEEINRLADNSNRINNQIFNDVVES